MCLGWDFVIKHNSEKIILKMYFSHSGNARYFNGQNRCPSKSLLKRRLPTQPTQGSQVRSPAPPIFRIRVKTEDLSLYDICVSGTLNPSSLSHSCIRQLDDPKFLKNLQVNNLLLWYMDSYHFNKGKQLL